MLKNSLALIFVLVTMALATVAGPVNAAGLCPMRGNPEVTNFVQCCCTTRTGQLCCGAVTVCGRYIPGCYCA